MPRKKKAADVDTSGPDTPDTATDPELTPPEEVVEEVEAAPAPDVGGDFDDEDQAPPLTPVAALKLFDEAMANHPNPALRHVQAEWKSCQREAQMLEDRQRARGKL